MARYDKYNPISGGFRAKSAIAWLTADVGKIFGVGLNTSGAVVKGAGNTGIVGAVVVNRPMAIGEVLDVMQHGEIVDAFMSDGTTVLTAGTAYYFVVATGLLSAVATAQPKVGFTVEASRLVVRMAPAGSGA